MGIFRIFGKKPAREEAVETDATAAKKTRSKAPSTVTGNVQDDEAQTHSLTEKKHIARATERKIDAIEFEMSRDMGRPKSLSKPKPTVPEEPRKRTETQQFHSDFVAPEFQSTIALNIPVTDLMVGHTEIHVSTLTQSESVPILEEAAILFATGQNQVAEQMLRSVIEQDNLGTATPIAWFMLFDFYQIERNQIAFDSLSLDYAGKYETSPPVWRDVEAPIVKEEKAGQAKATPSLNFPAQLDGDIIKSLQKLKTMSEQSQLLKLDFGRVKMVDPIGCGLLLRAMRKLQKTKHDLIVVGAQNLTEQIRSILQVGRRDETEAPWLLLLEILQLLQLKEAFEESSIDYCVTFEVSPPAFEAPLNKVTTAVAEPNQAQEVEDDRFMMPKSIDAKTDEVVNAIIDHAKNHDRIILDCAQLERVEFGASAQLLNGLVPIIGDQDKRIEFQDVNYLVMHLFNAMGLKNIGAIHPRKHS